MTFITKKMLIKKRIESLYAAPSIFILCSIIQKAFVVVTIPVFTRLLSIDEYGQYNVFISWMEIIAVFVTLKLSLGVYPQGLVKYEKDIDTFKSSIKSLSTFLITGWYFIAIVISIIIGEYFDISLLKLSLLFSMIWTTIRIEFWYTEKRFTLDYKAVLFFTFVFSLVKVVISIVFVIISTDKALGRIFGNVIVELIACLVILSRDKKDLLITKYWKYAIRFNIPLIPHYISQILLNSSDRLMINYLIGSREAGIYSLAYSISIVMVVFNNALMSYLSPWLYRKIKNKEISDIQGMMRDSMILVAIVNILFMLAIPELLFFLASTDYRSAMYIMPPIVMSSFFLYCYELFVRFEFYYEKTHYITFASCLSALANIIFNYIFIRKYGYFAAAYTTLICYVFYAVIHYLFIRKINNWIKNVVQIKKIGILAIAFFAMGCLIQLSYMNFYVRIAIAVFLSFLLLFNKKALKKIVATVLLSG